MKTEKKSKWKSPGIKSIKNQKDVRSKLVTVFTVYTAQKQRTTLTFSTLIFFRPFVQFNIICNIAIYY